VDWVCGYEGGWVKPLWHNGLWLIFCYALVNAPIHKSFLPVTATAAAPTTAPRRAVFPFTAVIGQEDMKLALLLNVIDPRIGGVMIMGDRGTGKSTTIRALADLLPEIHRGGR
jgi:predicted ATPase with chaperone activity